MVFKALSSGYFCAERKAPFTARQTQEMANAAEYVNRRINNWFLMCELRVRSLYGAVSTIDTLSARSICT